MTKRRLIFSILVGLSLASTVMIDTDVINRIAGQLVDFVQNSYQEKVYLHTDSDIYVSGEIMWMNARVLEAVSHTASTKSKAVHVQLTDRDDRLIAHKKLLIEEGSGSGDILLSDTLSSGYYTLRAFTSWMKNAPHEFMFEKEVYVMSGLQTMTTDTVVDESVNVRLFPEGGQIIQSLENSIAFTVTDQNGKGVSLQGVLEDDKARVLDTVATYSLGMGSFRFVPKKNRTYRLLLFHNNDTTAVPIQPVEPEGVNLIVDYDDARNVEMTLQASRKFIGNHSRLYVLVHSRGNVQFAAAAGVYEKYEMKIPREKLADGINHLTVFDEEGRPHLERLIFKRPQDGQNIRISGLSSQYNREEEVSIKVDSKMQEDAFVTISVHDRPPLDQQNIVNYLMLSADLETQIDQPQKYFQRSDSALYTSDLLMKTHQWKRFGWREILDEKSPREDFYAEEEGLIIKGRLINLATGQPLTDTMMVLSVYNHHPNFIFLTPRTNGQFVCALPTLYDTDVISVSPVVEGNKNGYRLELIEEKRAVIKKNPALAGNQLSIPEVSEAIAIEKRILENYRLHLPKEYNRPEQQNKKDAFLRSQVMGEVKFEIFPEDYVQLNNVSEMVFELLPSVKIRKRKGKDMFYVLDQSTATSYNDNVAYEYEVYEMNKEPATVFINGIHMTDHAVALGLSYEQIHKVEVYNQKSFPALDQKFHGVVSFTTKDYIDGNQSLLTLKTNEVKFEGYSLGRTYSTFLPESDVAKRGRYPDFRHSLYWSPNTELSAGTSHELHFSTSLVEGDFYLSIEGITVGGKPIFETQRFSVKR
jgi:hypothetical protein